MQISRPIPACAAQLARKKDTTAAAGGGPEKKRITAPAAFGPSGEQIQCVMSKVRRSALFHLRFEPRWLAWCPQTFLCVCHA